MRIKPGRIKRPSPLDLTASTSLAGINSPQVMLEQTRSAQNFFCGAGPAEPLVAQIVEQRVRNKLKQVHRGELTAKQALRTVVNELADELTNTQFATLVAYFKTKQTAELLTPAKHLLLQCLAAVKPAVAGSSHYKHGAVLTADTAAGQLVDQDCRQISAGRRKQKQPSMSQ